MPLVIKGILPSTGVTAGTICSAFVTMTNVKRCCLRDPPSGSNTITGHITSFAGVGVHVLFLVGQKCLLYHCYFPQLRVILGATVNHVIPLSQQCSTLRPPFPPPFPRTHPVLLF